MNGLFGANWIGTGNYGQRIVISAVDGFNGDETSAEDKGILILHS
jgi:hypothetical protein